ncbi:hypothetical protein [Streptomyces sp. NPDC005209]|uniref:hypothetical protein n=1 Tax=Streptomyces sp. NPDC005209 TaxID=3156715 RepID=UPI0033A706DD
MDESRHSSFGADAVARGWVPPPALCGFLLLLALMFTLSYAIGAAAGPVAPGMHGGGTDRGGGGGGGMDRMGDMGDTGDPHGGSH